MSHRIPALLAAVLLAALGCSSGGSNGTGGCPTAQPTAGTSCLLMNGTTCNYPTSTGGPPAGYCGGGGGLVAICSNGTWQYEATAGAGGAGVGYAACPVSVPTQGSACTPACGGAQQQCSYDCAHCNGSTCTATCNGSTWDVTKYTTPCSTIEAGAPDGDTDAAPDGSATEAGGDAGGE
jgi:hypothetical protein